MKEGIEAQNYENIVLYHEIKLRSIIGGKMATKVLTFHERMNLRKEGVIWRNGMFLEVSPRAQRILETKEAKK